MAEEGRPRAASIISRQASISIARQLSTTFTGGAGAVLPGATNEAVDDEDVEAQAGQPNARTPLLQRRGSLREQNQEHVQARMNQQILSFGERYLTTIIAVAVLVVVLICILAVLWFRALMGAMWYFMYSKKKCDQPLQYFLMVVLVWGQIGNQLVNLVIRRCEMSPLRKIMVGVFLQYLPGWCIVGWGVHMVHASKTCHNTNPGLYWPTAQYVYAQVCFAALICGIGLAVFLGWRQITRWVFRVISELDRQPGCEGAVHKLTKVPKDSKDLIDPDDNEVMQCSICMDGLDNGETAVRTDCAHYFHEECLATWCKSNLDCPLCRHRIGEPDAQEDV